VPTVTSSLLLLSSCSQRLTIPVHWIPELSSVSATSFSEQQHATTVRAEVIYFTKQLTAKLSPLVRSGHESGRKQRSSVPVYGLCLVAWLFILQRFTSKGTKCQTVGYGSIIIHHITHLAPSTYLLSSYYWEIVAKLCSSLFHLQYRSHLRLIARKRKSWRRIWTVGWTNTLNWCYMHIFSVWNKDSSPV
jgi:hypothetical protein